MAPRLRGVIGTVAILATIPSPVLVPYAARAHPGGLAADGCHNDRKNGGRHCHGEQRQSLPQQRVSTGTLYFANCDAARAAGAAPISRGQPSYASHLDRDGDGMACERRR
ncbi:excalibur calcium-binding domain-containing protein [Qipengyuania sp. G39]|uniref:Excalibur calcium-binding domain-containing protein n=1 Tax=Qipengyuania profundimaris TaxID=3067652 RepID=A0ABT9HLS4_9SPHN|nr:excalibur calcium-binding domain-containing protein [Qipengyuania sp. G39]MDP4574104.1 excalibur calcium-binding domain-containing protein [Qipengyuania sp. G39]